ncbi:MAG: hypothetical protein ABSE99_14800 [Terracidiphilus sp.]|jgi:hypothetical protein
MKLTKNESLRAGGWIGRALNRVGWIAMSLLTLASLVHAQAVATTTVQGTVYLANGQAGAGTLNVSWPAFTTANGQAVTAGQMTVTIAPDGFLSVNLAPNLGATPAGLYYTAVYQMSDGTTSTEYWVIPAAAQATLGQVRAQLMPAAQAVQTVSKAYVDQAIAELTESLLTASGGTLSGPLYLNGDPTQPLQAADKHYVDTTFSMEVPIAGGTMTGPLAAPAVNGVESPVAGTSQTTLQSAIGAAGTTGAMEIPPTYAGTDTFTNPNGVYVNDLRPNAAQQSERSVKEFGAVCDGVTDDTNALQAAIDYAQTHLVALTIPQGTCKTHALTWHGESIGGLGKQVSALMGFPGQDVLATAADSTNLLSYTRIHDLTLYVDQSVDVSCSAAEGRAPAGSCALNRPLESNSIFSPGGSGLTGTAGTGAAWAVGNCGLAMPAATGAGGNGLRVAEIENLEIVATGVDPLAAQYPGIHSTHTCGLYLAQWPQWSEFRNIDIRGLNTGVAIPALPVAVPAGLNADSNRWQNVTIQATHGFTAAAGSNNVLDNLVAMAGNSAATAEPPTGLVLDFPGAQQGWTVLNAVVLPAWNAVQPQLAVAASGGAVTGVTVGSEHGLGFDPYGTQVPLAFSGSCTAQASAGVNSNGSIGTVTVTSGGVGCSGTTTASINVAGSWDTAAPVNLISGQNMTFFAGNLLKGNGGYTVWNAAGSQSYGTQLDGGGGTLPGGGAYKGLVANNPPGSVYPVDQFPGADFGAKLQACLNALSAENGGSCDARNFTGTLSMASNLTVSTANATVLLPCATIATANQVIVTAGTRNVALRGCALRGASTASGSQGGTVFLYSGAGAMVQVGDPSYAADTNGFHLDNAVINTTPSTSATAQGFAAYRTQELDLESLYFLGNANQTGMTLDGTGNYTGGSFLDNQFDGFLTAVNAIGHQISNAATTDWMNASTFVRLHIDCPTTSSGGQIAGTYGINLQQGDGNTFTGGDVEGCSTALHLGPNAQNNTIVGLRNENSGNQVVADAGSAYNNWITGGTMFTNQLTDNGTRNSFLDTFHRSFNGLRGDWYGSQQDATITNHYRIGIGLGNERGLLNRYQTDYGYRWTMGLSDATAGEQFYQILDELNNVYRISIGQYNNGQSSTNNQTVINAAGTGAIVLNGSNNSGTGGVVFGSGGPSETTVATINNAGSAQFLGTLEVSGASTFSSSTTVKNQADAEIDQFLWAGLTTSQKESFIYKDWNGNSQWYMVKDASNNWALNSATGGLDSFKAYQSTNSGDTYIDASNASGVVRINYETGSGAGFNIYGGNSSTLYASFTAANAIKFPGLAASSGHNCVQIDTSGYLSNTGSACGSGSGSGGSGTISSGTTGQIASYIGNGTSIGGIATVPLSAGGTGAATAAAALANLNGISSLVTTPQTMAGQLTLPGVLPTATPYADIRAYGWAGGTSPIDTALAAATTVAGGTGASRTVFLPCIGGCTLSSGNITNTTGALITLRIQGTLNPASTLVVPPNINLVCDGGGSPAQFQAPGPICNINGPTVYGTLGTATTAINTPVTFTPTFGAGTLAANLPVNSAITIAGTVTCPIASITRTTASVANVTATLSSSCRIPPGVNVTIAGVTDSSFDAATFSSASDYPAQTVTWTQVGAASTSSGGTITGFNDDSFETVRIQAVSGNTVTATFAHAHSASDVWGEVAVATTYGPEAYISLEDVNVGNCYGACFWAESTYNITISNSSFNSIPFITSAPMELANSWGVDLTRDVFQPWMAYPCASGCVNVGYPYGLRLTALPISRDVDSGGIATAKITGDGTICAGIKIDSNGQSGYLMGQQNFEDIVFEQPKSAITVDSRYISSGALGTINLSKTLLQDNPMGYNISVLASTDGGGGPVEIDTAEGLSSQIVNSYYSGRLIIDQPDQQVDLSQSPSVINDGTGLLAELPNIGAALGPALIPYATLPVTTSPASWSCSGTGCSVVTGIAAPDGTATAGEVVEGTSLALVTPYSNTFSPSVGDCFLYGGWMAPGLNNPAGGLFAIQAYNAGDSFNGSQQSTSLSYQMNVNNMGWHPVVALACLTTVGSTGTHTFSLEEYAYNGNIPGVGTQYWMPFMIYIPASAEVSAGELARWRRDLLHGVVPPGMPAGGAILAVHPNHAIAFGNDTGLSRGAAGQINAGNGTPGDASGTYNAAGYKVAGTPLAFSNLTGSVAASQLPFPMLTTLGGVESKTCSANAFISAVNTDGSETCTTVTAAGNVTGPGASTVGNLASYNATNGQTIKDTGIAASTVRTTAGGQTITSADTLSGLPSGCAQLPCQVVKIAPTSYSGTSTYNPQVYTTPSGSQHEYLACANVMTTTAGTGGTFYLQTQGYSSGHFNNYGATSTINVSSAGSFQGACNTMVLDASTAVYINLSAGSPTGTFAIQYSWVLTMLQ